MRIEQIKEIASAVLYEGYLLYPYRTSAIKNRQRWTFGVVYPAAYSAANGGVEPCTMRTECLLEAQAARLDVHIRFLHLLICEPLGTHPVAQETPTAPEWNLSFGMANEHQEEGIEREITCLDLDLQDLAAHAKRLDFSYPGIALKEESDEAVQFQRKQFPLQGSIVVAAQALEANLFKLSIQIDNTTPDTATLAGREAIRQALVSTHTILQTRQGAFVSLMDPPPALRGQAEQCRNVGTWPVLLGEEGEHDAMLSSPIILYDYPRIAPESPGPLFDGTEIDELLTLRIMTLTDEEKAQMRQGDERVRQIIERTEALTPGEFMRMHGTIRDLRPVDEDFLSDHLTAGSSKSVGDRNKQLDKEEKGEQP